MSYHFSAYMYRLRSIKRWSLMRNTKTENVAEHSYHVALLTHLLCEIGNSIFSRQLNSERAATLALFHDATEVFTGDIPTPVKHHNPRLLSNFREMEDIAAERLLSMVPSELKSTYDHLLSPGKDNGEISDKELMIYVKAADSLDAYLKCAWELTAGNREFAVAKDQIQEKLKQLALPEVHYFLEHFAPSFEMTLDELS
ncbi:5'-deoxynucleotidase [Paenibacillus anaericanus]|uniref:5'-deoxynucleotidase n=1 Tax=Paenibacillus anaericanus TaxID=170367 RepID=A0A433Y8F5_9BACL|nr:5'-deoxynucleotidase [Paenibacillus anaericanus]MDQ0086991.1 5'-deoxynucleotidase [Paenibacillus anaericanus]RUT46152.1 5'-deoxynucleotidase [Paenibacillus anaericanus]